jgi:hypothetical protein
MQKSLLSLFLILHCWLLAIQPALAEPQDEPKKKMAEQLNKPVDYTDLPNLQLIFRFIMIDCRVTEDELAWERATKLVNELYSY